VSRFFNLVHTCFFPLHFYYCTTRYPLRAACVCGAVWSTRVYIGRTYIFFSSLCTHSIYAHRRTSWRSPGHRCAPADHHRGDQRRSSSLELQQQLGTASPCVCVRALCAVCCSDLVSGFAVLVVLQPDPAAGDVRDPGLVPLGGQGRLGLHHCQRDRRQYVTLTHSRSLSLSRARAGVS
jgi:hypothetical protein